MRAFVTAALVLAFVPSSLSAATISFEQTFTFEIHQEHPSSGVLTGIKDFHGFPALSVDWDIPAFDPALGTVEGLVLSWAPTTIDVAITSDPPNADIFGPTFLFHCMINGEFCEPGPTFLHSFATMAYTPESPQVRWRVYIHPDTTAYYDIGISATFDIVLTGPATATYYYTPAAAIPEPATLMLLASGLIGAEWKRRRGHL